MITNPTIRRCPSCNSECKKYFTTFTQGTLLRGLLTYGIWILFVELCLPHSMSDGEQLLIIIPLLSAFLLTINRLYHSFWAWRHPAHCGGGGLLAPKSI